MLFIIGFIVVCVSVAGGLYANGGSIALIWHPAEIGLITGVGIGSLLISAHKHSMLKALTSLKHLMKGLPHGREDYLELLLFFFNTTRIMKVKGLVAIENHIEHPEDSELFKLAPSVSSNNDVLEFIRTNIRLIIMGVDQQHQLDNAMENEIDIEYKKHMSPSKLYQHLADALPAIGIIAAVLGVILTMRSIAEPPEVLGSLIGAALVGTFTGVLLSYGFVGPIAFFLARYAEYQIKYLECVKIGILAYLQGTPPVIIVEFMRKAIPANIRPSFHEVEVLIAANTLRVSN